MNKKNKNKTGFTILELVIVIAVIAILATLIIYVSPSLVKKAEISKHHLDAHNIYTEYLQKNILNDDIIDDLAIKTEEDIYVIYIDGKAVDGIFTYEEVKEKFQYSLVKKYDQDDNILLVYDYDADNPNSYSKLSIEIKDNQTFTIFMFYIKLNESFDVDFYNSLVDEYYNIFVNYFGDHLTIDITNYVDKEIFEEYVILAIYRDEYTDVDFNYSDFNVESGYDINIIASENGKRENDKEFIDFIFIPKFYVYDKLENIYKPSGDYFSNCSINYIINSEVIRKYYTYFSLVRGIYEKSN